MKDSDNRAVHTFEFSVKTETETHLGEVIIKQDPADSKVLEGEDTFFRRGPNNWHNVMGLPLRTDLIKAVEVLHAEAQKTEGVTS